jgi:peptidoglycan biosynthesis protein MviN/MurJ (putative lipid II flippase)
MQRQDRQKLSARARVAHLLVALLSLSTLLLAAAPDALARYGRGLIGQTTDKTVTYSALLLIVGIVVLISLFSLLQWRLDKRKHAREDAKHAHVAEADWRGGW